MPIVTDDFDRANSDDLGSNWLEVEGNWEILNNNLDSNTAPAKVKWIGTSIGSPDQYVQSERRSANWQGVLARCTGTVTSDFYAYGIFHSGVQARLGWIKGTAGMGAYLDSGTTTIPGYAVGQVFRLEVEGQDDNIVLRFYLSGELYKTLTKAQFTDQSAILNSGEGGFYALDNIGKFADFEAGPLGSQYSLAAGAGAFGI